MSWHLYACQQSTAILTKTLTTFTLCYYLKAKDYIEWIVFSCINTIARFSFFLITIVLDSELLLFDAPCLLCQRSVVLIRGLADHFGHLQNTEIDHVYP